MLFFLSCLNRRKYLRNYGNYVVNNSYSEHEFWCLKHSHFLNYLYISSCHTRHQSLYHSFKPDRISVENWIAVVEVHKIVSWRSKLRKITTGAHRILSNLGSSTASEWWLNLINRERYPRALTAFDFTWMDTNKKIKQVPLVIEMKYTNSFFFFSIYH